MDILERHKKGENIFMNKFLTKIATFSVGLAMAIGVGVAVGNNSVQRARAAVEASVTFTASTDGASGKTHTKTPITITAGNGSFTENDYRVYKNANFTVESSAGNLKSLSFTFTGGSNNGGWNGSNSTYSVTNLSSKTWTKKTTSGSSGKQAQITSLVVTYELLDLSAPTPIFNNATHKVTWGNVANASSYKVSLDGTNYTTATSPYDGSFQNGTEYTVYVKAIGDGITYADSEAASVTFTPTTPPTYTGVTISAGNLEGNTKGEAFVQCEATVQGDNKPIQTVTWYVTETNTYAATTSVANKATISSDGKVTFLDNCTVYVWGLAADGSTHNSTGFAVTAEGLTSPKGSQDNPYTVTEAWTIANALSSNTNNGKIVYVKGTVSGTVNDGTYGASFDITDGNKTLRAYSIAGSQGSDSTADGYVADKYNVVVSGAIINYSGTLEVGYTSGYQSSLVSVSVPTFTVSFDKGNESASGTMTAVTDVPLGEYNLPECTYTAPSGKEFVGWKIRVGEVTGDAVRSAGYHYSISSDITLIAQWNDLVILTYHGNTASGSMDPEAYGTGALVTVKNNGYIVPDGKLFDGWNTSADGNGTSYAAGATFNISSNITLYAQWATKVTITYVSNGGTGTTADGVYKTGATAIVSSCDFTAPEGMKFKEWNTSKDGDGTGYDPDDEIASFSSNLTLYAIWEEKPHSYRIEYTNTTTSSNMSGNNDAEIFGLDSDDWNIYSIKNDGASNQIGLNKAGYLALYYYSGSDGNELHIEAKSGSPFVIKTVTLSVKQAASHKVFKGSTPSEVTGESEVYTINDTACYIKNTNSSNTQFQLYYVDVEWDYVDSFKDAQEFENTFVKHNVPYDDNTKGTNCLTWFGEAVDEYSNLSEEAQKWFGTRQEFLNARNRLIAWAEANKQSVSFNNTTGAMTVNSANANVMFDVVNSESASFTTIIIVISLVSVTAIGGYFFMRKRKEIK